MAICKVKYTAYMHNNPNWKYEKYFASKKLANAFVRAAKKNKNLFDFFVTEISPIGDLDLSLAVKEAMEHGYGHEKRG